MPRVARAVFAGVPHHITQRGNRRGNVFFNEADRECYLEWLTEYSHKYKLEILAYCLMTNHLHVVAVPAEDESLQRVLKPLHMRYAQRINRRRGWTGHLWQGRFFSSPLDEDYIEEKCPDIDLNALKAVTVWGSAPSEHCSISGGRRVTCAIAEYVMAAEGSGKRETLDAGDVITLDHGITLTTVISNATAINGSTTEVFFPGRRDDCGDNDLSVGLLLTYGDFKYFIGGDLTGRQEEDVAEVELLILDEVKDIDVYHINHHGADTSSHEDFIKAMDPTVAVVSNGSKFGHPRQTAMQRIINNSSNVKVYATNRNQAALAWDDELDQIADHNRTDYDGIVEIGVWRRSYRVWLWRDGVRANNPGDKFFIK